MVTRLLTPLREHQEEAVAAAPALELPAVAVMPPQGLRTQVI